MRTRERQDLCPLRRLAYHFVWGPMRLRPVLVGDAAARLDDLLREKAGLLEVELRALEIGPTHVYVAVAAPPTLAPHSIVCGFKAHSSGALRREYVQLSTTPSLWTREYLVVAGDDLSPDDVRALYEATLSPRRPRGRPRTSCQ